MKPLFKDHPQGQGSLFPEHLDDYIPKNHVVKLVSGIVDKLDISPIMTTYKGGGTSSLTVYTQRIRKSRNRIWIDYHIS